MLLPLSICLLVSNMDDSLRLVRASLHRLHRLTNLVEAIPDMFAVLDFSADDQRGHLSVKLPKVLGEEARDDESVYGEGFGNDVEEVADGGAIVIVPGNHTALDEAGAYVRSLKRSLQGLATDVIPETA